MKILSAFTCHFVVRGDFMISLSFLKISLSNASYILEIVKFRWLSLLCSTKKMHA